MSGQKKDQHLSPVRDVLRYLKMRSAFCKKKQLRFDPDTSFFTQKKTNNYGQAGQLRTEAKEKLGAFAIVASERVFCSDRRVHKSPG